MPFVYIIRSLKTGRYYTGCSADPWKRLKDHSQGRTRSLKHQGPFRIVHWERFDTVSAARKRENQIKRYKGGISFQKLLARDSDVPVV